jgi:LmbE family N-acetylglucosaminyl deacetylase
MRVDQLGTVLGVWAHPDDEAYLSAGLMAAARDLGQRVVVATATYGEQGAADPYDWSRDRLAALRRHELIASLAVAGVTEHRWLGFPDGGCADQAEAGTAAVARLLAEVLPDTILTFGPEGMTGHPDHKAISEWTTEAWTASGRRARLLYATHTPLFHETWGELNDRAGIWMSGAGPSTAEQDLTVNFRLTDEEVDRKLVALRAHASQTTGLVQAVGVEEFGRWWSTESFVAAPVATIPAARVAGVAR